MQIFAVELFTCIINVKSTVAYHVATDNKIIEYTNKINLILHHGMLLIEARDVIHHIWQLIWY